MKAKGQGKLEKLKGNRCKNGSYRRSGIIKYSESYTDNKTGELKFANMYQNFACFTDVARMVKAELNDGDEVYFMGDLKSYETEYYTVHYIEITRLEDLVKLPKGWDNERC